MTSRRTERCWDGVLALAEQRIGPTFLGRLHVEFVPAEAYWDYALELFHQDVGEWQDDLYLLGDDLRSEDEKRTVSSLEITVTDPGPGFDGHSALGPRELDPLQSHGRGIAILSAMACELAYNEAGNLLRFALACP